MAKTVVIKHLLFMCTIPISLMTTSYAWGNSKHMHVNWKANTKEKGIVFLVVSCEIPLAKLQSQLLCSTLNLIGYHNGFPPSSQQGICGYVERGPMH